MRPALHRALHPWPLRACTLRLTAGLASCTCSAPNLSISSSALRQPSSAPDPLSSAPPTAGNNVPLHASITGNHTPSAPSLHSAHRQSCLLHTSYNPLLAALPLHATTAPDKLALILIDRARLFYYFYLYFSLLFGYIYREKNQIERGGCWLILGSVCWESLFWVSGEKGEKKTELIPAIFQRPFARYFPATEESFWGGSKGNDLGLISWVGSARSDSDLLPRKLRRVCFFCLPVSGTCFCDVYDTTTTPHSLLVSATTPSCCSTATDLRLLLELLAASASCAEPFACCLWCRTLCLLPPVSDPLLAAFCAGPSDCCLLCRTLCLLPLVPDPLLVACAGPFTCCTVPDPLLAACAGSSACCIVSDPLLAALCRTPSACCLCRTPSACCLCRTPSACCLCRTLCLLHYAGSSACSTVPNPLCLLPVLDPLLATCAKLPLGIQW
ncbi:hypothetical protein SLEP1_g572 [Rubroshorea leprosula]|uniref:Uncharacterized protein n=1 Tax=Rubroshorea leprosula TaxID=152421 RepID=A0AAV5HJQ6_9ROSI|nr:hypothetical protein SLEP1_g572 [Rubroshorea leprosula]